MKRKYSIPLVALVPALAVIAALTTTSSATINDPNAQPQASWVIDTGGMADVARDVAVSRSGIAYVCGEVTVPWASRDGSLSKFPPSGAGWRKTWDGPARRNDAFNAVAVAPDGSVYTAGSSQNAAGRLDIRLVKWSPNGGVKWTRRYAGSVAGDSVASDVVVDAKGNVTVCGRSDGRSSTALTVVSWTGGGKLRWDRRIFGVGRSSARANAMVVDGAGNLYVTGMRGWDAGIMGGYTVKLSPAGATRWSNTYTGTDSNEFVAITRRPGGGVFVCGSMLASDGGYDGVLIRYKAGGGRMVFPIDIGDGAESTDTHHHSVAATPTGFVGVASSVTHSYGASSTRRFSVYDAATGAFVASASSSSVSGTGQRMAAVAADDFGGLYFTGTDVLSTMHTRIWTQRYSTIVGGGTWVGTFGTSVVGRHQPTAIATWKTTVWVVGRYYLSASDDDQMVLKYVY